MFVIRYLVAIKISPLSIPTTVSLFVFTCRYLQIQHLPIFDGHLMDQVHSDGWITYYYPKMCFCHTMLVEFGTGEVQYKSWLIKIA